MKVLLLNQSFWPDQTATSQQTQGLAEFLVEHGFQVTVIAGQRSYEDPRKVLLPRETYRDIRILRVPSTGFGKRSFFFRAVDGMTFELALLWKLFTMPAQDVVISFTSPPLIGLFGALFCLFRGGNSVQWLMDVNPDAAIAVGYLKRGGWIAKLLNAIFGFSLRHSHRIVVLDRWMKERIVQHGIDADRVSIVPPWPVHELTEPPANAGETFRQQHGLKDKFIVLYSGNHSIVHPLETLLDAATRLKDDPSVVFLFIGGGLRVRDVTAHAEKHGLKNVIQLPHQPRELLQDSLGCADLHVVVMGEAVTGLVHTSKIYGVLGTGKPYVFIGPRRSHVVDLQRECPHGYHVEHGRAEDLVNVIRRAQALTREERATIARENLRFVTTHYAARKSMALFASEVLELETAEPTKAAIA